MATTIPLAPVGLGRLARASARRLALTYGLCNLENALWLAQPWALGAAVSGLVAGSQRGLAWYVLIHLGHLVAGSARRAIDTRTFGLLYGDLAARVVLDPGLRPAGTSALSARAGLCKELVSFLELDVPFLLQSAYAVVGSFAALAMCDGRLAAGCAALTLPVAGLNAWYARRCRALSRGLHDRMEDEVGVIGRGDSGEVIGHYRGLVGCQVRLSDAQAAYFVGTQALVLALVACGLRMACLGSPGEAGALISAFRYVTMFSSGLDGLPLMVHQSCRLGDILGRIRRPD